MSRELSIETTQALGFEWPMHALIEKYCVVEDGEIDLAEMQKKMRSSQAFYQQ